MFSETTTMVSILCPPKIHMFEILMPSVIAVEGEIFEKFIRVESS